MNAIRAPIKFCSVLVGNISGVLDPNHKTKNFEAVQAVTSRSSAYLDTYLDTWSGFEAAKTAPWPSQGLHHCGKFLEPSDE